MTDRTDPTWSDADAEVARRLRATMALRAADMPPAGPMPGLALLDRPEPTVRGPAGPGILGASPGHDLPPLPVAGGEPRRRLVPLRRRALAVAAAVLAAGGLAAAVTAGGGPEPARVADAPSGATTTAPPPTTVPGGPTTTAPPGTTTTAPPDTTTTAPGGRATTTAPERRNADMQMIGEYSRGVEGESVVASFEPGNGNVNLTAILGENWQPIEAGPNRGYRTVADLGNSMIWLTMSDGIVRLQGGALPVEELVPFAAAVTRGADGAYTLTPPDGWVLDEGEFRPDPARGATTTTAGVGTTATTLAPATTTTAGVGG